MMTFMQTREIEYHADDRRLVGTLVTPDGAELRPGVVVFHEGPGLDDHAKGRAQRLGELGYVAFAADYHGGGVRLPAEEMRPRLAELIGDPMRTRVLAASALDVLLCEPSVDHSRIAAIGFCFGGTTALELARSGAEVHAVVGFHSGLSTSRPGDAANIKGAVLACIGADDPMIPVEQRAAFEAEMRAGGVDWQLQVYGGAVHSFTNQAADAWGMPGIAYHAPTDARSWAAMLGLFEERFGVGRVASRNDRDTNASAVDPGRVRPRRRGSVPD